MERYEDLVGRFEGELGRNLYRKERDFINWMIDQHVREQKGRNSNIDECYKTLLL